MPQAMRNQARHWATDCILQVSRHWETGRIRFRKGFNFSKKAPLVNLPTHTMWWWNKLWLSQKRKHLMI